MLLSWLLLCAPSQRGQTVAVLNEHVSAAAASGRQQAAGGVRVRPLGQPQLSSSGHLFMSEPLENKVRALGFVPELQIVTQCMGVIVYRQRLVSCGGLARAGVHVSIDSVAAFTTTMTISSTAAPRPAFVPT